MKTRINTFIANPSENDSLELSTTEGLVFAWHNKKHTDLLLFLFYRFNVKALPKGTKAK